MASFRLTRTSTAQNPNVHDLYLDDSGQLEWIGGDIEDSTSYARMVLQRLVCRMWQLRGEWYLDQRTGTPWLQRIMVKGGDEGVLTQALRAVALSTPGIRQVVSLDVSVDRATREATVTNFQVLMESNQQVTLQDIDEPFIISLPEATNG